MNTRTAPKTKVKVKLRSQLWVTQLSVYCWHGDPGMCTCWLNQFTWWRNNRGHKKEAGGPDAAWGRLLRTTGLTGSPPFWFFPLFWTISMHRALTNSSYRFNTTDFTFSQYHPQTLKMKSYQKLSPTSYLVGVVHFDASPWSSKSSSPQHTISHLHQITHTCRGCHPEYVYASILCHTH